MGLNGRVSVPSVWPCNASHVPPPPSPSARPFPPRPQLDGAARATSLRRAGLRRVLRRTGLPPAAPRHGAGRRRPCPTPARPGAGPGPVVPCAVQEIHSPMVATEAGLLLPTYSCLFLLICITSPTILLPNSGVCARAAGGRDRAWGRRPERSAAAVAAPHRCQRPCRAAHAEAHAGCPSPGAWPGLHSEEAEGVRGTSVAAGNQARNGVRTKDR